MRFPPLSEYQSSHPSGGNSIPTQTILIGGSTNSVEAISPRLKFIDSLTKAQQIIEGLGETKTGPIREGRTGLVDSEQSKTDILMNWESLIEKLMEGEERPVVLGEPATPEAFARLSKFLERDLPEEFVSLYSCHDGIGSEGEGKTDWQYLPIAMLPNFVTEIRNWFEETHPSIARRFFPFFDWGNGDAIGYLWDENECLLPHLYEFSHEHYEFEVGQNWEEFVLEYFFSSIEEFIIETSSE